MRYEIDIADSGNFCHIHNVDNYMDHVLRSLLVTYHSTSSSILTVNCRHIIKLTIDIEEANMSLSYSTTYFKIPNFILLTE